MTGMLLEFKYLNSPSSFRASIAQLGNEGFTAFRLANKAMYGIEVLTSQFEEQLNKILKIVFNRVSRRHREGGPTGFSKISKTPFF